MLCKKDSFCNVCMWPIFLTIWLFSDLHSVSIEKSFGPKKDLLSNASISKNHHLIPFGTMFESTERNFNFLSSQALYLKGNLYHRNEGTNRKSRVNKKWISKTKNGIHIFWVLNSYLLSQFHFCNMKEWNV